MSRSTLTGAWRNEGVSASDVTTVPHLRARSRPSGFHDHENHENERQDVLVVRHPQAADGVLDHSEEESADDDAGQAPEAADHGCGETAQHDRETEVQVDRTERSDEYPAQRGEAILDRPHTSNDSRLVRTPCNWAASRFAAIARSCRPNWVFRNMAIRSTTTSSVTTTITRVCIDTTAPPISIVLPRTSDGSACGVLPCHIAKRSNDDAGAEGRDEHLDHRTVTERGVRHAFEDHAEDEQRDERDHIGDGDREAKILGPQIATYGAQGDEITLGEVDDPVALYSNRNPTAASAYNAPCAIPLVHSATYRSMAEGVRCSSGLVARAVARHSPLNSRFRVSVPPANWRRQGSC